MNVSISMNAAEVQRVTDKKLEIAVDVLKSELDSIFKNKISTPDQVISIYDKLAKYKLISGKDYQITLEENTIV